MPPAGALNTEGKGRILLVIHVKDPVLDKQSVGVVEATGGRGDMQARAEIVHSFHTMEFSTTSGSLPWRVIAHANLCPMLTCARRFPTPTVARLQYVTMPDNVTNKYSVEPCLPIPPSGDYLSPSCMILSRCAWL